MLTLIDWLNGPVFHRRHFFSEHFTSKFIYIIQSIGVDANRFLVSVQLPDCMEKLTSGSSVEITCQIQMDAPFRSLVNDFLITIH